MPEIKLTKSELRSQQTRLVQLQRYLPTLQLKKAMLQSEINNARLEIVQLEERYQQAFSSVGVFSSLLADVKSFDLPQAAKVDRIHRRFENIAGVEVPYFESVEFAPFWYSLFETPPWVDPAISSVRNLVKAHIQIDIAIEKKTALEKELREVSIRVNLFEKVLIPRSIKNIKRIKVFLGDQQLAAVSQAKVAKTKVIERKAEALHAD